MKFNYDEISPITGNKSVMREDDLRICFESGYHTYDSWEIGSPDQINFASKSPNHIVDTKKIIDNQVWYLLSLFSENHILIPDDEFGWIVNTWRDREEFCEVNYELTRELSNGAGQKYIQVLDKSLEKHFIEFEDAYNEFQKRKNAE